MMLFLMLCLGSGYLGVRVLSGFLWRVGPAIPPARVANTEGAEYAYQQATDLAARGTRKLGTALRMALGAFLLLWPIAVVYWLFASDHGFGAF